MPFSHIPTEGNHVLDGVKGYFPPPYTSLVSGRIISLLSLYMDQTKPSQHIQTQSATTSSQNQPQSKSAQTKTNSVTKSKPNQLGMKHQNQKYRFFASDFELELFSPFFTGASVFELELELIFLIW